MRSLAALAVFVLACSSSSAPTTTPPGSGSSGSGSSGSGSSDTGSSGTGSGSSMPPQTGDNDPSKAPPGNAAGCKADTTHCCQADGTIIAPTCSPVIHKPSDQWKRGADGMCQGCPLKCLPPATRIRTPHGDVAVDELRIGDLVLTEDAQGRAVAMPLVAVHANPRSGPHALAVVELADGRVVHGSPEHPTATGATLGALVTGDLLDGARVIAVRREPFTGAATWDVLPAGPTGTYWADGVLLGSTLRNR
jgi:Hint domain-containing protein